MFPMEVELNMTHTGQMEQIVGLYYDNLISTKL